MVSLAKLHTNVPGPQLAQGGSIGTGLASIGWILTEKSLHKTTFYVDRGVSNWLKI